nr:dodecin family protein [Legionella pneumophila]
MGPRRKELKKAIDNAIKQVAKTHGKLDWFEVVETRGFIDDNKVKYYQVHLKVGCNV